MEIRVLQACLLFLIHFSEVKCNILLKENCTFILSNGDYEEFLLAVPMFENCTRGFKNAALAIKLMNYTLPGFPNGTFTNLPYLDSFKLEISNGSKIHLFSPLLPQYFIFKNMKVRSVVLDISDSSSLNGWKWEALSEFDYKWIKSFEFIAVRSKIMYLSSNFSEVANAALTAIRILNCHLRWLGKNVFGPFYNLMSLELRDNLIEKFERFHLPHEAPKLHSLDLGKNRLQYISSHLFTDFKLKQIFLDGNNIKILSNQVETILASSLHYINGIIWPCDCNQIKELFEKFANILEEKCYEKEKGIKIKDFRKNSCQLF